MGFRLRLIAGMALAYATSTLLLSWYSTTTMTMTTTTLLGHRHLRQITDSFSQTTAILVGSDRNEINQRPVRKWAYAYMIAGANPEQSHAYMGFLYTILNTAYVLNLHRADDALGDNRTRADLLVMVQMSFNANATELPVEHTRILTEMGVKIIYMPKPNRPETFYSITMIKFYILSLVEYSRVMFLDSDLMLYCPLDYMFDMSEPDKGHGPPVLRENIIHSANDEAANAGLFVMTPAPGRYEQILDIIEQQNKRVLKNNGKFNETIGWGHVFQKPHDYWRHARANKNYLWNWYGVTADQGLMYYWTKYVMRDVSILEWNRPIIENWVADDTSPSKVRLDKVLIDAFDGRGCRSRVLRDERLFRRHNKKRPLTHPWRNFWHFLGPDKPWIAQSRENMGYERRVRIPENPNEIYAQLISWFYVLDKVVKKLNLKLDVSDLDQTSSALGRTLTKEDMVDLAKGDAS